VALRGGAKTILNEILILSLKCTKYLMILRYQFNDVIYERVTLTILNMAPKIGTGLGVITDRETASCV
jgi:hypothetical protein